MKKVTGLLANFFRTELLYRGKCVKAWQRASLKSFIRELIALGNKYDEDAELKGGAFSFYEISVTIGNICIYSSQIRDIDTDELYVIFDRV